MGSRSPLFVPLGAGIRTDLADKLLPLGKDLEVENMQFDQAGALVKRFGHLAQSVSVPSQSTTLQPIWQLATHKGARVSLSYPSGQNPIATYSSADAGWNIPSTAKHGPVLTSLQRINANGNAPRIASGAGFYFLLYKDLLVFNQMRFDMVDVTTGHTVSSQTFVVGGGSAVAAYDVIFCNGFAVAVTYESTGNIVFRTLTPSTKAITTTTFVVGGTGSSAMDVTLRGTTAISVAFMNAAIQLAGVDFTPSTLTTSAIVYHDATAALIPLDLGHVAWVNDFGGSGKVALATVSSTQGLRVQWDFSIGATRTAATTYAVDASITANVAQLVAYTTDVSATGSFVVLTSITGSPLGNYLTRIASRNGGVVQAPNVLFRSLVLLSKAWTQNNAFYALFSFTGDGGQVAAGNSYVMQTGTRANGQPPLPSYEAIFGVGNTGNTDQTGLTLNSGLTSVVSTSSSTFVAAVSFLNRIGATASGSFTSTTIGIEVVTINHTQPTSAPVTGTPVEIGNTLVVPGGAIGQFDGIGYGEMGFAYSPFGATLASGAGGAMTPSATYWYVFVFARPDGQGRYWRSGVSIPISVTLGGGDGRVTIGVPTLRVTGWGTTVTEIYRGAANDEALFQKVGQVNNDVTVDSINFVDTFSDTQIAQGEEVYTGQNDNAILNNDTIPGSSFVFVWQNRVWFISADDPTELWFSNVISPGNGWRFNAQNIVRLSDAHGPTYAAGVMDDKIVAIKADAVYSWNGDGPDDAGNGGYAPPLVVALGIGSTNPRSVVSSKDGVFFDSTSNRPGIQMIDHGLNVASAPDGSAFAGAVQRYATEQIMSAILVPEQSQVRFYCLSGRVLVYDMISKNWTTFLLNLGGAHAISAIATNGGALIATDAPEIWLEDTAGATYTDAGRTFGERLASPWIAVGGVNGFERVIQMIGSGKTIGDHTLTVQKLHNYDDNTIVETRTFAETVASTPLWNWQWNRPRVARMSALKLILSENSTTAGFKTEGVSLLMGLRDGLNRQPTTTRGP